MKSSISRLVCCSGALLFLAAAPLHADVARLVRGGEIRGEFDRSSMRSSSPGLVIRTLSGAVVTVAREQLDFIARRPLKVEEYETRAKRALRTVKAQWELAEWCREHRLREQRVECLQQIVAIDPEHEAAHLALGHELYNGRWMTVEEIKREQGLVKHQGRYITTLELELLQQDAAERERELQWYRKVRLWKGWLADEDPQRRSEAWAELKAIDRPEAVPALTQFLQDSPAKSLRQLYVNILAGIPGPKPVQGLVRQSLEDQEYEIRYLALDSLREEHYPAAAELYARNLRSDLNYVVRRAATGLAKVGNEDALPQLIDALTTTHTFRVRVPDRQNTYSFGTDGSFANGNPTLPPEIEAQLRTGQLPFGAIVLPPANTRQRMKTVTVKRTFRNSEVLAALEKITGKSFGYDQRSWRLWLSSKSKGLAGSG